MNSNFNLLLLLLLFVYNARASEYPYPEADKISEYRGFEIYIDFNSDHAQFNKKEALEYLKKEVDRFLSFSEFIGVENLLVHNSKIENKFTITIIDQEEINAGFGSSMSIHSQHLVNEMEISLSLLNHLIKTQNKVVIQHEFGHGVFLITDLDSKVSEAIADLFANLVNELSFATTVNPMNGSDPFASVCDTEAKMRDFIGKPTSIYDIINHAEKMDSNSYRHMFNMYDISCYFNTLFYLNYKRSGLTVIEVFKNLQSLIKTDRLLHLSFDLSEIIKSVLNQTHLVEKPGSKLIETEDSFKLTVKETENNDLRIFAEDSEKKLSKYFGVEFVKNFEKPMLFYTASQFLDDFGNEDLRFGTKVENDGLFFDGQSEPRMTFCNTDEFIYGRVIYNSSYEQKVYVSSWAKVDISHIQNCYTNINFFAPWELDFNR